MISETIPKLEAFRADYSQGMAKVDGILEQLEAVSVSAVCSKDIKAIKATLQVSEGTECCLGYVSLMHRVRLHFVTLA